MPRTTLKQKILLIIFSLILFVILLEVGLRLGGFIFLSLQEYRNRLSLRQKGTYRIMCLGESTTVCGDEDSYPSQLQEILSQRNIGISFSVINKGVPCITSTVILLQLEENLNKYRPDMVITMMGINDDIAWYTPYEYAYNKKTEHFFKTLRIYKLSRLLRLHIINKAKEIGIYRLIGQKQVITDSADESMSLSKYEEITKRYKKAIELNPRNDKAYRGIGRYYTRLERYKEAE